MSKGTSPDVESRLIAEAGMNRRQTQIGKFVTGHGSESSRRFCDALRHHSQESQQVESGPTAHASCKSSSVSPSDFPRTGLQTKHPVRRKLRCLPRPAKFFDGRLFQKVSLRIVEVGVTCSPPRCVFEGAKMTDMRGHCCAQSQLIHRAAPGKAADAFSDKSRRLLKVAQTMSTAGRRVIQRATQKRLIR